jgi:hypothetical protein
MNMQAEIHMSTQRHKLIIERGSKDKAKQDRIRHVKKDTVVKTDNTT